MTCLVPLAPPPKEEQVLVFHVPPLGAFPSNREETSERTLQHRRDFVSELNIRRWDHGHLNLDRCHLGLGRLELINGQMGVFFPPSLLFFFLPCCMAARCPTRRTFAFCPQAHSLFSCCTSCIGCYRNALTLAQMGDLSFDVHAHDDEGAAGGQSGEKLRVRNLDFQILLLRWTDTFSQCHGSLQHSPTLLGKLKVESKHPRLRSRSPPSRSSIPGEGFKFLSAHSSRRLLPPAPTLCYVPTASFHKHGSRRPSERPPPLPFHLLVPFYFWIQF